jgi:hypothetical protein
MNSTLLLPFWRIRFAPFSPQFTRAGGKLRAVVAGSVAILAATTMLATDAPSGDEGDAAAATAQPSDWVQLLPPVSPSPRGYFAMAYDADSDRIILFGGFDGTKHLRDTWAFDGTTWKRLFPNHPPTARAAAQMAYDAVAHRIVLFGGYDGQNHLGDTWTFNGATSQWRQQMPAHSPPAATGPMLFPDPVNAQVDVFGGYNGQFYQLDMWQWQGTDWKQLHPDNVPTARSSSAVALNPTSHKVILYGGLGDVNPVNTWTYDGINWTQRSPEHQPHFVYAGVGIPQPARKTVVVFGGAAGGAPSNMTWRWIGTNWKRVLTAKNPVGREGTGAAYFPKLGHSIMFGGQNGDMLLNDTWALTP